MPEMPRITRAAESMIVHPLVDAQVIVPSAFLAWSPRIHRPPAPPKKSTCGLAPAVPENERGRNSGTMRGVYQPWVPIPIPGLGRDISAGESGADSRSNGHNDFAARGYPHRAVDEATGLRRE